MPVTPQITLTANLESILAGAETGGYLRITLCGSGPIIPAVPGTSVLADALIPQILGPQVGSTPLSIELYGNDVIVPGPDVTFYEVAVLDKDKNVIQAGNYRFDGTETIDLSEAVQIVAPYGFWLGFLKVVACTGAVPGTHYQVPAPALLIVAVLYNGVILDPTDYSVAPGTTNITLNFATEIGPDGTPDKINALCVA